MTPEERKIYNKKYRADHAEELKMYRKKRYLDHAEDIKMKNSQYRLDHPDKYVYARMAPDRRDKQKEYSLHWREKHREQNRDYATVHRLLKKLSAHNNNDNRL